LAETLEKRLRKHWGRKPIFINLMDQIDGAWSG